jgi:hypothetical protein
MTVQARSKRDHELWAHEIAELEKQIPEINAEAGMYGRMANSLEQTDPNLCAEYKDWQAWTEQRASRARERLQRIRDYLAGKIGAWW